MKNEDTFKDLHLYEDEETIQKTLRYLEIPTLSCLNLLD